MTNHDGVTVTFLGLSKTQFLLALAITTLIVACISVGALAYAISANRARNADNARVAEQLHASQCAQRRYTQKRIESTADFLAKNGGPEPIAGVSRYQLLASLRDLRELRSTFDGLNCPTS